MMFVTENYGKALNRLQLVKMHGRNQANLLQRFGQYYLQKSTNKFQKITGNQ